MRICKVLLFKPVPALTPKTLHMIVYQDAAGWYYPKKYVEEEGFLTPFYSHQELEMIAERQLQLVKSLDVNIELGPKEKFNTLT